MEGLRDSVVWILNNMAGAELKLTMGNHQLLLSPKERELKQSAGFWESMELSHPRFVKWEPGCTEPASSERVRYKGPGRRQPGSRLSSAHLTYCMTSGKLLNLSVPLKNSSEKN